MALGSFLLETILISLSGVMAPGPISAVAVGKGTDSPYAGALVAVGHGVVEFPLIALVTWGLGSVLQIQYVETVIFALGGAMLLYMGIGMVRELWRPEAESTSGTRSPIWAGVLLSASSPYFLVWWATVGASLIARARAFGMLGLAAFAMTHWSCDVVWDTFLSAVSFRGGRLLGRRFHQTVLVLCALFLIFFGGRFIVVAAQGLR
jgi:threonine/homoserine/homoserine lactone efflux protein